MNCTIESSPVHQIIKSLSIVLLSETSILVKWVWNISLSKNLSSQVTNFNYIYSKSNDLSCFKSHPIQAQPNPKLKIEGLEADSQYIVCIEVHKTSSPYMEVLCDSVKTGGWQMTHSIGSSVGAILALAIVMALIVLVQATRKKSSNKSRDMTTNLEEREFSYPTVCQYYSDSSYPKEFIMDENFVIPGSSHRQSLSNCPQSNNYIIIPENQSLNHSNLESIGVTLDDGTHQCSCGLVHVLETLEYDDDEDDAFEDDEENDTLENDDKVTSHQEKIMDNKEETDNLMIDENFTAKTSDEITK